MFDEILSRKLGVRVVGYDSAPQQINLANKRNLPDNIFKVADHNTFTTEERFDAAVSVLVLPYAKNATELTQLFQSAHRHLKDGTKFISAVFNPDFTTFGKEIGSRIFEKCDDNAVKVRFLTLPDKRVVFSSELNQFSLEEYEQAASSAGFSNLFRYNLFSDAAGEQSLGVDFWKDIHHFQPYQLLTALK